MLWSVPIAISRSLNNRGIDHRILGPNELNVASLLAGFYEACVFKAALDFTKGRGLSRPNLDLNCAEPWRAGGKRRLEVKFQRFAKVG